MGTMKSHQMPIRDILYTWPPYPGVEVFRAPGARHVLLGVRPVIDLGLRLCYMNN
jgi:hypothetical protein